MYSADTSYGGGGVTTSYTGGAGGGGVDPFFYDLMKRQLALKAKAARPQPVSPLGRNAVSPSSWSQRPEMAQGQERAVHRMSGGGGDDSVPFYVKPATMFNSTGGYMKALPTDPGAVYAGRFDPRSIPQGSAMTPVGGQDDAARQGRNAAEFQRFQAESAQRRKIGDTGGYDLG